MEIQKLDQKNWGVCGFVAAIQAACANHVGHITLQSNDPYEILFPVIQEFCNNNKGLEKELLDFSATFGKNYRYKSFQEIFGKMQKDRTLSSDIGIAMTGHAMTILCKQLGFKQCDFHGTTKTTQNLHFEKNTIYGLRNKNLNTNFRYGLVHWIYVSNKQEIMSWGKYEKKEGLLAKGFNQVTHYITGLR